MVNIDQRLLSILHTNIICGYSLEVPRQGASNEYPQLSVLWRYKQNYHLFIIKYSPQLPYRDNYYKVSASLGNLQADRTGMQKFLSSILPLVGKHLFLLPKLGFCQDMSLFMRKLAFCICENKAADQLCGSAQLISAFVFLLHGLYNPSSI